VPHLNSSGPSELAATGSEKEKPSPFEKEGVTGRTRSYQPLDRGIAARLWHSNDKIALRRHVIVFVQRDGDSGNLQLRTWVEIRKYVWLQRTCCAAAKEVDLLLLPLLASAAACFCCCLLD
jgi:hypothetical protein